VKAVAAGEKSWKEAVKETKFAARRATEPKKTGKASVPIPMTLKGAYDVLKRVYENASKKKPDAEKTESGLRKIEKLIADFRNLLNEAAE
jgi:hypothetical protein